MTKEEIKEIIKLGEKKHDMLPLVDLIEIQKSAHISLKMDRDANEYYYAIKLNELDGKEIKPSIWTENKWILSEDEEEIRLFI